MIVKSFCCCCPLACGAFIIGVIYALEAACLLGVNIFQFNNLKFEEFRPQDEVNETKQFSKNYHFLIILNLIHILSSTLIFLGLCTASGHYFQTTAVSSFTIHLFMMLNACARAILVKLYVAEIIFFPAAFVISYYFTLVLWSYGKELEANRNAKLSRMSLRVFCCGDSMSLRYASISLSVFIIVLTTLQTASTAITINKLKDDETYKHMANALYVELTTNVMIFVNLLLVICVLSLKYPYCIQCLAIFYACEIIFRFVLACVMAKMNPNYLRICRDYVSLAVYFYAALIFWNFNKDQKSSEREIKSSVAHELLISVA